MSLWIVFGLVGQTMFFLRFLIQWIASERKKQSVIPVSFWFFSIIGGLILLIYAIQRKDPVFIIGQSTGSVIYIRNLVLIYRKRKEIPNAVR
ncbi:MAG: lipid-A-disaccharide synthase N-terminal domain-containing protein [bacterium]